MNLLDGRFAFVYNCQFQISQILFFFTYNGHLVITIYLSYCSTGYNQKIISVGKATFSHFNLQYLPEICNLCMNESMLSSPAIDCLFSNTCGYHNITVRTWNINVCVWNMPVQVEKTFKIISTTCTSTSNCLQSWSFHFVRFLLSFACAVYYHHHISHPRLYQSAWRKSTTSCS